jgi:hypothetical protein
VGFKIDMPGGRRLTVVGAAYSVSQSAGAWVTPEDARAGVGRSDLVSVTGGRPPPSLVRAPIWRWKRGTRRQ